MANRLFTISLISLSITFAGTTAGRAQPPATQPAPLVHAAPAAQAAPGRRPVAGDYVLHLPGIDGPHRMNRDMLMGLKQGGIRQTRIYDWTGNDSGIDALRAIKHNHAQAKHVARLIVTFVKAHPNTRVHVVSHSGGAGVAVWALEDLPANVKVYSLVLLSSALSPAYDLSAALSHVEHRAFAFNSFKDSIILGVGTMLYGTIDRVKTPAGGQVGFVMPTGADAEQYKKLQQFEYDPLWSRFDNRGDHMGPLHALFAKQILAPLLLKDKAPPATRAITPPAGATTRPAEALPASR
jgi:pimeloyl-ACP methyl ester carboxylesterase